MIIFTIILPHDSFWIHPIYPLSQHLVLFFPISTRVWSTNQGLHPERTLLLPAPLKHQLPIMSPSPSKLKC